MNQIFKFLDFVVLAVMRDYQDAHDGKAITYNILWNTNSSAVNDWLEKNGVTKFGNLYTYRLTSNRTLIDSLSALRSAGLVEKEDEENSKSKNIITDEGRELLEMLGDDWQKWPRELPFSNGSFDFDNATYVPTWDEN